MTPALDTDLVPCGCGYSRRFTGVSFDEVVRCATVALESEGFGVLTVIDVQATLLREIGKRVDRHIILGVCNPHLAFQALDIDLDVDLLFPCNVSVREHACTVTVSTVSPRAIFSLIEAEALEPFVAEVDQRLKRALGALT